MDLLDPGILEKLEREEERRALFREHGHCLRVVSTADPNSSLEFLLDIKLLFQRMLPKMPREYIIRQVFDPRHCCLALTAPGPAGEETLIGAVCYRAAFDRHLVEIVFLAVNNAHHITGYGAFIFSCLKEIVKRQYSDFLEKGDEYNSTDRTYHDLEALCTPAAYPSETPLYLLTYADNSAVGFFKKQGFSANLESTEWRGYIKDYAGGTLMECKVVRDLPYLRKRDLVAGIRMRIFEAMKTVNEYHIVRTPSTETIAQIQQVLAGLPSAACAPRSPREFLYDLLGFFLYRLRADPSAWPFLEPVSTVDVPDYLTVITHPMDLSTIAAKHRKHAYTSLRLFADDMYLMVNNCYTYNGPDSQYYKCAENMQRSFEWLLEKYERSIARWGFIMGPHPDR